VVGVEVEEVEDEDEVLVTENEEVRPDSEALLCEGLLWYNVSVHSTGHHNSKPQQFFGAQMGTSDHPHRDSRSSSA